MNALRMIIPEANTLGLDEIHMAAQRSGFTPEWKVLRNWEKLDDLQIWETMLDQVILCGSERGILLPNMCVWAKKEPFVLAHEHIKHFIGQFLVQYQEAFFNGDTLILLPSSRTAYLFHHEGRHCKLIAK